MFQLQQPGDNFQHNAPARFSHRLRLRGDAQTVFEVIADGGHESEWFPDFKAVEWLTPAPYGAGAVRRYRLTYMTLVEQFTHWDSGRELSFWVSECSIPMLKHFAEYYRIEPAEDGWVDLTWDVCYAPLRILQPLHPLVRPMFARDFRKAASNLESYCARLAAG